MVSFLKITLLTLTCASLIACGKSDEQKAKSQADTLVAEYNALVQDLNSSALPNESWTDDQLNKYEDKLDRMVELEAALANVDGKNGVMIFGANNQSFVSSRRSLLQKARSAKLQKSQTTTKSTTKSTTKVLTDFDIVQDLKRINVESESLMRKLDLMGDPTVAWSLQELNEYKNILNKVIANTDRSIELSKKLSDYDSRSTFIAEYGKIKTTLLKMLELTNLIIASKY
ncbi:hypothetical protein K2X05_14170 [bacterium]|nr:hypothetical protein [bacterium]